MTAPLRQARADERLRRRCTRVHADGMPDVHADGMPDVRDGTGPG